MFTHWRAFDTTWDHIIKGILLKGRLLCQYIAEYYSITVNNDGIIDHVHTSVLVMGLQVHLISLNGKNYAESKALFSKGKWGQMHCLGSLRSSWAQEKSGVERVKYLFVRKVLNTVMAPNMAQLGLLEGELQHVCYYGQSRYLWGKLIQ